MITVLIAESDPSLQEILRSEIRSQGHAIVLANDGEDIVRKIRDYKPDLIILNSLLPSLEAHIICEQVRKDFELVNIPIIVLAHFAREKEIQAALDSGADAYLTIQHPFPSGVLRSLINAVLRRARGKLMLSRERTIQAGNLRVDLSARIACLNDAELRLSHREFDLLTELIRNKGVVLSREVILSRVWAIDQRVDTRTVDVHIRWLREKIEQNPSRPKRIVTIRGIGYRFDDDSALDNALLNESLSVA